MTTRFIQKQLALENVRVAYFRAVWRRSSGSVPRTVGVNPLDYSMCALPHIEPMFPTTEHTGLGTKEWELDWLLSPLLSVTHLGNMCFVSLLGLGSGKLAVLGVEAVEGRWTVLLRDITNSTELHNYCVVTLNFSCKWGRREGFRTTGFPQAEELRINYLPHTIYKF